MKRAVIVLGAGASLEYGAPSTGALTNAIERAVLADADMKRLNADDAFKTIKSGLETYLEDPGIVHFEQIYHCAHELISTFAPAPGTTDEFRPLLHPFVSNTSAITKDALQALVQKMANVIFAEVSASCGKSPITFYPFATFLTSLMNTHITRIYTTNYDDFPLQAVRDLYTGFDSVPRATAKPFELDVFWDKEDLHSVFHLHGSVHMGFPNTKTSEIGELHWFDDRAEALKYSSFHGSTVRQMDGTSFLRTAVITGLDKLSRLQQRPLSYFYSAMARDTLRADVIYVIGSGLGDLHLNTWLHEARSRNPMTPILLIDYWKEDFQDYLEFNNDRKLIDMIHALRMNMSDRSGNTKVGMGWTVSADRTAAAWQSGFQGFLNSPADLGQVLGLLKFRP
jgi:hypothetical protein